MQQLENDSFDLVMKQLRYDLQALKVAAGKRANWESTVYHTKLQHKVKRHELSVEAGQFFLQNYCKVITSETSDGMLAEFNLHRQNVINRLRLDSSACATW